MNQEFIDEIAKMMVEKSYNEGSFVFKEGDLPNGFYTLEEGNIKLTTGEKGRSPIH